LAFGTAARPGAILDLTSFQIDPHERTIKLNPPGRAQTKKRRPTIAMCETLVPFLRSLPPGPVIRYNGRRLKSIRPAFGRLKVRARRRLRDDAAREARRLRRIGERGAAGSMIEDAKARGDALLELTPYTIRHTVASELRRRGVAPWELAGLLGHSSGYKTTERYAKFSSDHLGGAAQAVDNYFMDLEIELGFDLSDHDFWPQVTRQRVTCVSPWTLKVVELGGLEPPTSTMPL
ncbi:MAG: tyrosine-type recombinase/integrase, partial [Proteobacteria bacterium]|nr:tyrosine-type recombinase/integrase [Pseudomonadota bacterium]